MTEIRYDTRLPADEASDRPRQEGRAQDWYDRWHKRIHDWVARHSHRLVADLLLLLPDFLLLILGLLRDKRVPFTIKLQLGLVLVYLFSPLDFLPEAIFGVLGLSDDVGLMTLALYGIQRGSSVEAQILRDHWRGDEDVLEVILSAYLTYNRILNRISPFRRFFRRGKNKKS